MQKIERLGLESRARELKKNGQTTRDIAEILSKESGQKIAKSTVSDFFKADDILKAEVIEKQDKLKVKVTEAEISTLDQRQEVISGLLGLARYADSEQARVQAYKAANDALDSLDKRLGKLSGGAGSQEAQTIININQNNLTIKDKIQRYRDAGLFNAH